MIAPRRPLPPVPGVGPAAAPPVDETSWYDPHDLLVDSGIHTGGTAAEAARDLVAESGRLLVLDEQLLAALDAAAKAAEARRALTAGAVTAAPGGLADLFAPPAVGGPSTAVAPVPALPPLPLPVLSTRADLLPVDAFPALQAADAQDEGVDARDDDDLDDEGPDEGHDVEAAELEVHAEPAAPAVPELDVAAEFARHDDLVETGRHAALDDAPAGTALALTDTGRHHLAVRGDDERDGWADDVPALGTLTHRTLVTRGSGRRWIPVGVGAGVLSIVAAVLLTSGFASNGPATDTDEAARTGASTTEAAVPSATTTTPPPPAMNTLDLSGPVVVDDSDRPADDDADRPAPTSAAGRTTTPAPAPVQPQVAAPPAADTPVVVETPAATASTATLTAETAPPPVEPVTPETTPSN
ncbi:hypothetical protein [Klenkia marina]|uniref:hypothetical protein n=1 Tax=Klenkia marina TaxID=1960309 RepID=UPI001059EE40|nr:hypothetical protein [Klenkia marina]